MKIIKICENKLRILEHRLNNVLFERDVVDCNICKNCKNYKEVKIPKEYYNKLEEYNGTRTKL